MFCNKSKRKTYFIILHKILRNKNARHNGIKYSLRKYREMKRKGIKNDKVKERGRWWKEKVKVKVNLKR